MTAHSDNPYNDQVDILAKNVHNSPPLITFRSKSTGLFLLSQQHIIKTHHHHFIHSIIKIPSKWIKGKESTLCSIRKNLLGCRFTCIYLFFHFFYMFHRLHAKSGLYYKLNGYIKGFYVWII